MSGIRFLFLAGLLWTAVAMAEPAIDPDLCRRGEGTPAQFLTDHLRDGSVSPALWSELPPEYRAEILAGKRPLRASDPEAVPAVRAFLAAVKRGFAWRAERPRAVIPRLAVPPAIDGEVSADEWREALQFTGEIPLDRDDLALAGKSRWFAGFDDQYLYLAAVIAEDDPQFHPEAPFEGDSVEFFLLPEPKLGGYWEVVTAPGAPPFIAFHTLGRNGRRLTRQARPAGLRVAARRIPGGFSAELAFPFAAFPALGERLPHSKGRFDFLFLRTDRKKSGTYHISSPVPLLYGGHNLYGYIEGILP